MNAPDALADLLAEAVRTDLFAAGLALGSLGLLAAALRGAVAAVLRLARRRLWASLSLDNRHEGYRHLLLWLEATGVLAHARHLRMADGRWTVGTAGLAPAPGRHWFVHAGRLCRLDRRLDERARIGGGGGGGGQRPMETLTIAVLLGPVSLLAGWIEAGARLARERDRTGPGLHVLKGDWWDAVGTVPHRGIDTVLADDGRVAAVLADMRRFYAARGWYADRGVPWRRGYLLHGPPGTGKSSLVRALASELDLDIASLDVGRAGMGDDDLREAMIAAPAGALIAVEDVDAVFTGRGAGERRAGVSFSGLLNAIDGYAAQEGRALVMTTNHRDRLDPALIRPGRIDVEVELGLVGADTAARLFGRFFPGEDALARRFAAAIGSHRLSPAAMQGWLLRHRDDPRAAAEAKGLLGTQEVAAGSPVRSSPSRLAPMP